MKTFYGIQLGNYLKLNKTGEIIEVNGITKKKVGYFGEDNKEHYYYLPDVSEIPLTPEILEKHKEHIEDWKQIDGVFYIIPEGSGNLYTLRWFHELQNILELNNHRIKWID